MDTIIGKSGRVYETLPIDPTRGFPQSFPFLFAGRTYHFTLHVNAAASVTAAPTLLPLPSSEAFLVVRVERERDDGGRELILARKVLPDVEYFAAELALAFPEQRVARNNLNGQGDFGSLVRGGIASRWA